MPMSGPSNADVGTFRYTLQRHENGYCRVRGMYDAESGEHMLQGLRNVRCRDWGTYVAGAGERTLQGLGNVRYRELGTYVAKSLEHTFPLCPTYDGQAGHYRGIFRSAQ